MYVWLWFYTSLGNISTFVGYNFEINAGKAGIFAFIDAFSMGYKGKYIYVSVTIGDVGFVCGWDNGKFRFRIDPPGTPGIDISINFWKIIKDIFGW